MVTPAFSFSTRQLTHTCQAVLLKTGQQCHTDTASDFHRSHSVQSSYQERGSRSVGLRQEAAASWTEQTDGSRGSPQGRLSKQPHKPPLPVLLLTNTRSISKKLDEVEQTNTPVAQSHDF